jgi:hypothetical protein
MMSIRWVSGGFDTTLPELRRLKWGRADGVEVIAAGLFRVGRK